MTGSIVREEYPRERLQVMVLQPERGQPFEIYFAMLPRQREQPQVHLQRVQAVSELDQDLHQQAQVRIGDTAAAQHVHPIFDCVFARQINRSELTII